MRLNARSGALLIATAVLSTAGCGGGKSTGEPFSAPYYELDAQDGHCGKQWVIDSTGEIWTQNTCVPGQSGFQKTFAASAEVQSELPGDFDALPNPPNTTCPATGGPASSTASGTALLLGDGVAASTVTFVSDSGQETKTWVACQFGSEFVPPFEAVAYLFTGQP